MAAGFKEIFALFNYKLFDLHLMFLQPTSTNTGCGWGVSVYVQLYSYFCQQKSQDVFIISVSPPSLYHPQAVTLPLSLGDGKWHHVCVTWSTRDGQWEAYQDGVQRGSGINLSPWHPIKPGGVFILGQEQVKFYSLFMHFVHAEACFGS